MTLMSKINSCTHLFWKKNLKLNDETKSSEKGHINILFNDISDYWQSWSLTKEQIRSVSACNCALSKWSDDNLVLWSKPIAKKGIE